MIRHLRASWLPAVLAAVVVLTVGAGAPAVSAQARGAAAEQSGPYPTLLIRNVTVIDGSGAPAFGPVNIVVKDNMIDRVEPVDAINAGRGVVGAAVQADRVIDGTGMYVMPGLVDGHVHVSSNTAVPAEYIYKLFLGHGVTTIRVFNIGRDDPRPWWRSARRAPPTRSSRPGCTSTRSTAAPIRA